MLPSVLQHGAFGESSQKEQEARNANEAQLGAHTALAREKTSQELQGNSPPDTHSFPSSTMQKISFKPFLLMNS